MYLAILGFLMVIVFMTLIITKRLSPLTALIIVPMVFGFAAGYGWDTFTYAMNGIEGVASTFAMMTFAIFYFGVLLYTGLFDPPVDAVLKWCKGDPLKVLIGTALIAALVSLDGDGTTTVIICCSALVSVYDRLKIKKIYLAVLVALMNSIINLFPWGGPTARVMAVLDLDAGVITSALLPCILAAVAFGLVVSYYWGLKERKRLGVVAGMSNPVQRGELTEEEAAWRRPKLFWFNLILTILVVGALIMGLASSAILFAVGTAIILAVNYPDLKQQRDVLSTLASDVISVIVVVMGAGVLMGVLDGPGEGGMSMAITQFLIDIVPESMSQYFAYFIALIGGPGVCFLNNDAFYYGVLPPLAATASVYGMSNLQIGVAALLGQAVRVMSPLVTYLYLLFDKTETNFGEYYKHITKLLLAVYVIYIVVATITGQLTIL